MIPYAGRRLLGAIPVLWGVATLVFIVLRLLPGDPAEVMLSEAGGSAAAIAELREQFGLDDPLLLQYGRYMLSLLRGDLGTSLFSRRPVLSLIGEQLPSTLELALAAMLVALFLGVGLGVLAAVKQRTWWDRIAMILAVSGVSLPIFWTALLLIWLLSLHLRWLPATGAGSPAHLLLPALVLGFASAGAIARLVRASLLEVLSQDYVNTARAKGLSQRLILLRHALKNALIPVITIAGLQFGFLLGGAVVTETIFARPGIGRLLVSAIQWKDLPLVQGIALLAALSYTLVNLAVDATYAILDPRIRYD